MMNGDRTILSIPVTDGFLQEERMAYLAGYDYDVFISYAAVDDQMPFGGAGMGWVSMFFANLQKMLPIRLGTGDGLSIYFDRGSLHGNHDLQEITAAVSRSAIFLAVTSPAYSTREWTRRELETFVKDASDSRRLFAVEYLPLDAGERHVAPLDSRKRLKFWEIEGVSSLAPNPITPQDAGLWMARLGDLTFQIKDQLKAMKAAETASPSISRQVDAIAAGATAQARTSVYLAQTHEDLDDERDQVARYLQQYGFAILPQNDLPGGGAGFRDAARADIAAATLYVHLLGPKAGRYPADLPDGYGATQIAIAREAGKEIMLWRHPELDPATVTDPRQRALLSDEAVEASGLESFKAEILRRLQPKPARTKPKKDTPSLVFINASKDDYEGAKIVQREFEARGIPTVLPLYDGSPDVILEDLKANIGDSDVIVFLYGNAPLSWVRSQMRQFNKLRPGAHTRMVAIFVGPPDDKPADIGISLPDLRRVESPSTWAVGPIRHLIEEIEA
jgi:hypothetical protein